MKSEFEKLPEVKDSLSENIVFIGNKYTTANDGFYDLVNWLNGAWYAYQHQQSKVDELTLQVAEMKSRLNDAYTDGQSAMYAARQSKVDELKCELKRINLWYSNVKLQLENKEIDSAIDAKKIDELQKRLDAALKMISINRGFAWGSVSISQLEQALKGDQ